MAEPEPPLVSVVTPSLNQARFIEQTIAGVAAQDYPRIEHLVVDGGSTDGTVEVLRRHPELRWVSEVDGGQADAISKGFRLATGSIFAWLNADDLYLPGAVSTAVAALRESGAGLVYGGWRQIDERGETIKDVPVRTFDYHELLEVRNLIAQPTAFFTREAYDAVGGLDTTYQYAMDYDLWLKLGARFEVHQVDSMLAAFRFHPRSKTVAQARGFGPETIRASRRHGARIWSPLYVDWYLPRYRPWLYRFLIAYRLLRRGDVRSLVRRIAARASRSRR